jgi:hypothetical protein
VLIAIGQVLPLAVAGALSSVPVVCVLTLLLGSAGRAPAVLFAVGYTGGVVATSAAAATVFGPVLAPLLRVHSAPVIGAVEVVLGACATGAGLLLVGRHRSPRNGPGGRLAARLADVRPVVAAAVGVAVALRPKALLLATGTGIAVGGLPAGSAAGLLLVAGLVATSSVTVPVAIAFARPDSARERFERARSWLGDNAHTVTIVVLVLVGVVLVGDGLSRT